MIWLKLKMIMNIVRGRPVIYKCRFSERTDGQSGMIGKEPGLHHAVIVDNQFIGVGMEVTNNDAG